MDYYIGQVGINPNDFWGNTWSENQRLGESYNVKQNLDWERFRYLATMIHNVNCTKKSQMIKPEKLFPLPQDKLAKSQGPKSTIEQFEAFKEKARRAGVKI